MLKTALVIAGVSWGLLIASVGFFVYQGAERDTSQRRDSDAIVANQRAIQKQVEANCKVVAVLLDNRADRDKTVKLFDSIRQKNPKLFDRLVKRAEAGDQRLKEVRGDLACKP